MWKKVNPGMEYIIAAMRQMAVKRRKMVTATLETEKEKTCVLKGKTVLSIAAADGDEELNVNAVWMGEKLKPDEVMVMMDTMIEKHIDAISKEPEIKTAVCAHLLSFITDIQKEEISKLLHKEREGLKE